MAEWWESAPIVESAAPDGDWWVDAPVVEEEFSPEMQAGLAELSALSQPEYQNSFSGIAGQVGAGSNEGIAQMLGFPVEALNSAIGGIGDLTGLWEASQNPVGGQKFFAEMLSPFNAGVAEPQSDAERFARRVGEEVGASAVGLPLALGSAAGRAAPLAAAGVEGASALGSGAGAAAAEYIAPDSVMAEIIGALLGGVPAGMAASRAAGLDGGAAVMADGTMESQKRRASDAYDIVRADQSLISPAPVLDSVNDVAQSERLNRRLQPTSNNILRALNEDLGVAGGKSGPAMPVRVEDIENMRRVIGGSVSPTDAPSDQRIAGMMKDELTSYLDSLNTPASEALREGRDATRRYKAAEMVAGATEKAERRAASTGSGGNEINAIRQNLRSILDNPSKSRSFTASERAAMEEIVRGSTDQNLMRRLSRFAPSSGGLASMLGIGGALASPAVALPIVGITEGAKMLGERSTQKSVDQLIRSLLGERVMQTSGDSLNPVIQALLAGRVMSEEN